MKKFVLAVSRFIHDEEGASAVEYGILVALIAAAIIIIVTMVGQQVRNAFNVICNAVRNVTATGTACTF